MCKCIEIEGVSVERCIYALQKAVDRWSGWKRVYGQASRWTVRYDCKLGFFTCHRRGQKQLRILGSYRGYEEAYVRWCWELADHIGLEPDPFPTCDPHTKRKDEEASQA
jgi:hypothetical protein